MKTRVQKWGNSLALRIPKSFAAETGLGEDSLVDLSLVDGKLVVDPLSEAPFTLKDLLRGITRKNVHAEVDAGPPRGGEAW